MLVNGVPVVIAQAGDPVSLSGRSTDPGSDDLTLTWIWDDGSPDTSTLYLNDPAFNPDPDPSPTINPRDVTDTQSHAFAACLYDVGFRAEDDDSGVSATDTVKVLITGTSAERFSAGYWQNVYRSRKSTPFTDEQLECYLEIATFVSNVFSEVRAASTIPQAFDVLKVGGKTTAEDQFDRQLLAALLNFANGDPDFDELIDTDGNGTGDTAFLQVMRTSRRCGSTRRRRRRRSWRRRTCSSASTSARPRAPLAEDGARTAPSSGTLFPWTCSTVSRRRIRPTGT